MRLGCKVVGLNEKPDLVVVFNHKSSQGEVGSLKFKSGDMALVVFEPEVVAPVNHAKWIRSKYCRVYVPSPMWKKNVEDRVFDWPQTKAEKFQGDKQSFNRQDRFVMILGNHVSVGRFELYSLRRDVATIKDLPLDLFGPNWLDSSLRNILRGLKSLWRFSLARDFKVKLPRKLFMRDKPSNYFGETENKFETYSRYKFSLVIENSSNYLSEKLVDAVISGTIPIYVGPNLDTFGLPRDMAYCVVGDSRAIQEAMGKLMESKVLQKVILDSGREFLQSPRYLEMVNTQALRNLANMIVTDLLCREECGE